MAEGQSPVGYDDTPFIPDSEWRVHDANRPQPTVITAGTNVVNDAPSDATVLFDGSDFSRWAGRDGDVQWKVENGYGEVNNSGDIETKEHFGDCQLHVEWAAPAEVKGNSQGRGNSGVFLMGLYEIQILDGYDNRTYSDGITAAIYGQYPPLVNACREPGAWQTYDVVFNVPHWSDEDSLISPAFMTVIHNGVVAHNHQSVQGPTGHRTVSNSDSPHAPTGPLKLQDHGDQVRYRNIWIRNL